MGKLNTFCIAVTILFSAWRAEALQVERADGWRLKEISKNDKLLSLFAGGAKAILVPEKDETGLNPVILILKKDRLKKTLTDNRAEWRDTVFPKFSHDRFFMKDEVLKTEDGWRYIVEILTDTGSENNFPSLILATAVDGDLYIVLFENHVRVFHERLPQIQKLFREIRLKN